MTFTAVTSTVQLSLPPFDDIVWEAEVDFLVEEVEDWNLPYGLLGREGFMDRWVVTFNAYANYFIVEHPDDFVDRLPVDPVAEFEERYGDYYG